MEHNENFKTTVVGVSLLFIVFTSAFSLVSRLVAPIVMKGMMAYNLQSFLFKNILWIIIAAAIIITLTSYAKKLEIQSYSDLVKDTLIRKTAGLLIIIGGLIDLSNLIPSCISSIISSTQVSHLMRGNTNGITARIITSDIISIIIILCQVFLGFWLIKLYKEKASK